ncbi:MAG: DUF4232 domain-containing protein [Acidimicrobiales bacterium]
MRLSAGLAAAAAGALLLAACSSPRPSAESTSTTGGSSITGASSSTTGAGTTHCLAADLAVSVAGSEGAAGTNEITFALRNSSSSTCAMEGFPGAQLYDASGAALPTTVVRGGSYNFTNFAPANVVLAPGAIADFNMGYSDVPTGNSGQCPTAASLWITPPDDVDHAVVTEQIQACSGGKLSVSPVFAQNSSESQTTAPANG